MLSVPDFDATKAPVLWMSCGYWIEKKIVACSCR
jgi:hypothetical protein